METGDRFRPRPEKDAPRLIGSCWPGVALQAAIAFLPAGAMAVPIFQADFSGTRSGTAGAGDIGAIGGMGALGPGGTAPNVTNTIGSASPFSAVAGNYVNSSVASGTTGAKTIVTFTPTTAANSWAALVATPINTGGINYLNLNGAFDIFVRPISGEAGAPWFRPVDITTISGPSGARLIFNGISSGGVQFEFKTGAGAGLGSLPGAFTTNDTWILPGAITGTPNQFTTGAITHLGVTFKTNPATGQITVKVFGAAGTNAIDTSSDTVGAGNLLARQSFYASADAIGAITLPTGAWTMTERSANGASFTANTSVDYDSVRLYNSDPGSFGVPGIFPPVPPTPPDWSSFDSRKKWLLGLEWPAPTPAAHFGMAYNLANLYKFPAGSANSNNAVSYTASNLSVLTTFEQLQGSEFFPLGVVRAIYQFGDRFSPAQLAQVATDTQRMYFWYGGGTENHHLMRLSNGYLLAQKFPAATWLPDYPNPKRSDRPDLPLGTARVSSLVLMSHNKEELRRQGSLRFDRSFSEASSPNYIPAHLIPMLNLYEFAQDPEVKRIAEGIITHILAHLSVNVYRGYILDPYPRFYNSVYTNGGIGPGVDDGNKNDTVLLNWLYWNQCRPEAARMTNWGDCLFTVYPALSSYRPPAALDRIANLASDNAGKAHWVLTSEPIWAVGGAYDARVNDALRRRVWRDREFAVGSMVGYYVPNTTHIQDGSRFGIAYRSTDRLQYIQAGHPYWLADESGLNWWQAPHSPFMQVAHYKNTAIIMFNIPSTDPWPNSSPGRPDFYFTDRTLNPPQIRRSEHANALRTECAMRYPLSMDETDAVANADGTTWYFLHEGNTYIGIRTLTAPGAPQDYAGVWKSLFATAVPHGGRSQTGFVVEIGTSTASGGQFADFAAFKAALTPRQPSVAWGSGTMPSLSVQYTNSQNVTLSASYDTNLTSDSQGRVRMFPSVSVNGAPDLSDPWPDIDARLDATHPLVTLVNKVLTITDPATGVVKSVDWSGNLPALPPQLAGASSRKNQGGVDCDTSLPLTDPAGVECRYGAIINGYQVVLTFDQNIASGAVAVTAGAGSVSATAINGATMTATLSGVSNQQALTLTASNVTNAAGQSLASAAFKLRVLQGDVNGDGVVNAADLTGVRNSYGTIAGHAGFDPRADLNADGAVNAADITTIKDNYGRQVP
ncbi:MAG: dockerin type I domain-containing protein [Terrimicrobiaceae bacterium]|nr:dockerin type I domain-containing protein [Terrimicrobiaceae bacterium]